MSDGNGDRPHPATARRTTQVLRPRPGAGRRAARSGRGGAVGCPPSGARTSAPRCAGSASSSGPRRRRWSWSSCSPCPACPSSSSGRACSAMPPTSSSRAFSGRRIDFGALHRKLLIVVAACTWRRGRSRTPGVHPRRGGAAVDVPAARIGRAQDQPAAAQLHRQPGPRRPAQPGDQRHRQPVPEPAADDRARSSRRC